MVKRTTGADRRLIRTLPVIQVDCSFAAGEHVREFQFKSEVSSRADMYITDAKHFLDEKGAISPKKGPAKIMAEFHAAAIAYATDFDDAGLQAPMCFKCKKVEVAPMIAVDEAIYLSRPVWLYTSLTNKSGFSCCHFLSA